MLMLSLLQAAQSPRLVGVNLDDLIALAALNPTAEEGDNGPAAQSRNVSVASGFLTTPDAAAQLAKLEPGAMVNDSSLLFFCIIPFTPCFFPVDYFVV